jgi:predicted NBD/HSP70 family sugar kinase
VGESVGEVLELVRSGRAATRSDLRRLTGMSRTAVVARVSALTDAGLLLEGEELKSTGGRPPGGLVFNAGRGVVLGVAVGRSRAQVSVADLDGHELGAASVDHVEGAGPDTVMAQVAEQLALLLAEHAPGREVFAVGLSLPGTIDPVRGLCIDSPVMAAWEGVDLRPHLASVSDAPVFVGNDADVLARSERLGAARHLDDILVLKASTGLGLGIVAGGRVVSGHLGGAGELGHTTVAGAAGRPCRCGNHGCLETIAGGWALVAASREAGRPVDHIRDLVDIAASGDPEAKAQLREGGRLLGEVLAVAINLLNPQAVVIGGDMAGAFDAYAAGIRESVYARSSALATRDLQFLPSTFGDRAGVVGCVAMALDEVLSPDAVDDRLLRQRPAAAEPAPASQL